MGYFGELKRRNIFRVGTLYVVGAWVLLQIAKLLLDIPGLPDTASKCVLGLLILGAPIALFLAWAYELTPEGLRSDPGPGSGACPSALSGRHFDSAIIALLIVAVAYFSLDKFILKESLPASTVSETSEIVRSVASIPFVNHGGDAYTVKNVRQISDELSGKHIRDGGARRKN